MAVAAHWESSAATGVNGNQGDDSLPQAGAVYIFTRSGATWTQQAYLKASNTGRAGSSAEEPGDGDQFGFSLALSRDGNTLAVGANSEDSNAAGAKSDQRDDSFNSAGAVYVFARNGTTWAQQAYLKADASTNTGLGDQFGFSVALNANGNTLAVGVYDESGSGRAVNAPIDRMRGGSGAVYVFVRSGATWTREAYLKTWNAEGGDSWGVSVALSDDGNTLATGSLDEDCVCTGVVNAPSDVGASDQKADLSTGAAAIFVRSGADVEPAGLHQSLELRPGGLVRRAPRLERRWQHARRRRAERRQRRPGNQRAAERRFGHRSGRGLSLHAQRRRVVAAGVRERREYRGV